MPKYTFDIPKPCSLDVDVLYGDEHILVVSKPAGLLSVPGRYLKDSVLHRMLYEYPDSRIVHRLDLDTSGLMVLAQSQLGTSDLNRQFRERLVNKTYLARVYGELALLEGEIDLPLAPNPDDRPRQMVDHDKGKTALTRFERISVVGNTTNIRLFPITGRSHQLRVHLAAIGHPILGCDLYAHEEALRAADRLCLHASILQFNHPATQEPMTFESTPTFSVA